MKKIVLSSLFSVWVFGAVAFSAQAQQDQELLYQNSVKYVCTGIGESKEDPRWSQYPLKLMFTTGGRAYVSNVAVKIKDSSSNVVFEGTCNAPWLLVSLKPGKYQVEATALQKYTRNASVQVQEGKKAELAIRFSEITGDDL